MSSNLVVEMPETEVGRFEKLIDEINAIARRMREEGPAREAEIERLQNETRRGLEEIWATIENVEKTL